jgi:hypothetical protein
MQCAEDHVRYCCQYILQHCKADVAFLEQTCVSLCSIEQGSGGKVAWTSKKQISVL